MAKDKRQFESTNAVLMLAVVCIAGLTSADQSGESVRVSSSPTASLLTGKGNSQRAKPNSDLNMLNLQPQKSSIQEIFTLVKGNQCNSMIISTMSDHLDSHPDDQPAIGSAAKSYLKRCRGQLEEQLKSAMSSLAPWESGRLNEFLSDEFIQEFLNKNHQLKDKFCRQPESLLPLASGQFQEFVKKIHPGPKNDLLVARRNEVALHLEGCQNYLMKSSAIIEDLVKLLKLVDSDSLKLFSEDFKANVLRYNFCEAAKDKLGRGDRLKSQYDFGDLVREIN